MTAVALSQDRVRQFLALTKPRVVSLIVFTAVIGMFLAAPGLPPLNAVVFGTLGIALVAGAAAAINCLVEQKIDALMARTRARPLPRGELSSLQTLVFASIVGACGLAILRVMVNPLTMWLTLATFVGYAIIYTVLLKPATPQNIVIGGASGAMPPVLGWAAVTNDVAARSPDPVPDHFRLDAAAFLVAGPVPRQGIRARQGCRCCRSRTAPRTRGCTSSSIRRR